MCSTASQPATRLAIRINSISAALAWVCHCLGCERVLMCGWRGRVPIAKPVQSAKLYKSISSQNMDIWSRLWMSRAPVDVGTRHHTRYRVPVVDTDYRTGYSCMHLLMQVWANAVPSALVPTRAVPFLPESCSHVVQLCTSDSHKLY